MICSRRRTDRRQARRSAGCLVDQRQAFSSAARARSASSVASGSRSPKRRFQVPRAVDGQPVAAGEAHQRSFVGDRSSVTRRRDRQDNCLIRAIVRVWCQWAAALFDAKAAKVRKVHKEAASCAAREAHSIPSRRSLRSFAAFASNNLAARSLYRPHGAPWFKRSTWGRCNHSLQRQRHHRSVRVDGKVLPTSTPTSLVLTGRGILLCAFYCHARSWRLPDARSRRRRRCTQPT